MPNHKKEKQIKALDNKMSEPMNEVREKKTDDDRLALAESMHLNVNQITDLLAKQEQDMELWYKQFLEKQQQKFTAIEKIFHEAENNPELQRLENEFDKRFEKLIKDQEKYLNDDLRENIFAELRKLENRKLELTEEIEHSKALTTTNKRKIDFNTDIPNLDPLREELRRKKEQLRILQENKSKKKECDNQEAREQFNQISKIHKHEQKRLKWLRALHSLRKDVSVGIRIKNMASEGCQHIIEVLRDGKIDSVLEVKDDPFGGTVVDPMTKE
eukprot:UN06856